MAALRVLVYDDGEWPISPPSIVIGSFPACPNWMDSLSASELENLKRELDPRVIMGTDMALNKGKSLDQVVDILKNYGFTWVSQEVSQKADGEETEVEMYKQY